MEVKFCKLCTISNYRPSTCVEFKNDNKKTKKDFIQFYDGICSACIANNKIKKNTDWNKRKNILDFLLNKLKKKDIIYDVIIPASGGKDSLYACYILKKLHKAKCLSVTWAPHIYTLTI